MTAPFPGEAAPAELPQPAVAARGLSQEEARARLAADGDNEMPSGRRRGVFGVARDVAREPMFLLLLAAGAVYLLVGDPVEASPLLGFVIVVMALTVYQERRTERALEALRDLASPRALVIRSGERHRISGREVVRGDVVILAEGDRVPADGLVVSSTALSMDESLLTGESVPVAKSADPGATGPVPPPGGDGAPWAYSGTLVVRGHGLMVVRETAGATAMGRIGRALQTVTAEPTPLQRETGRIVRGVAVVAITVSAAVVVAYGLLRADWLRGLLAGITLAMSLLPEEFPVILTVFLALGAWRLSRQKVLTRRVPAVEGIGAVTVLCVDKTGTLTLNRMTVRRLVAGDEEVDLGGSRGAPLPATPAHLARTAVLASLDDPYDPMEVAIHRLGALDGEATEARHAPATHEYPLSAALPAMARVYPSDDGAASLVACKGAPEAVVMLCRLDEAARERITARVRSLAAEGLRVLAVAEGRVQVPPPDLLADVQLRLLGLLALEDPVRDTVPGAVAEAHRAGIQVVMITGDYPGTALSIARQAGLEPGDDVLTGTELEALEDAALRRRLAGVKVVARVVPEQKLRIVQALQADGEVVAMTGDGVNDAPALKAAHIGIAMGGRGADVAREAAAVVLLDDDFTSIVEAVRLGRHIFDNLTRAMRYALAVHVPIAGLSLVPVLAGWPLILLPVHIAFLELVIDPACSVVFEADPPEGDEMRRPPRDPARPLFSRRTVAASVGQGAVVLAILIVLLGMLLQQGWSDGRARGVVFGALVVANLGLILSTRAGRRSLLHAVRTPNVALRWVLGLAITVLVLVDAVPPLRGTFGFGGLRLTDALLGVAAGAACVVAVELTKPLWRGRRRR